MTDKRMLPKLGPDVDALRVCSTAGIELLKDKRVQLDQLRRSIYGAMREIEEASDWETTLSRMLLAANLTKASCEAFLDMAGAMGKAFGIKNAELAGKSLNAAIASSSAMASAQAGQKADWLTAVNKSAEALAIGGDRITGQALDTFKLQTAKVDVINSAIKGDRPKALGSFFLGYLPKIADMSFKYMEQKTLAKWNSAIASISKAGYNYSLALDKAFNQKISDSDESADRRIALLKVNKQHLAEIMDKIALIDGIMERCAGAVPLGRLS